MRKVRFDNNSTRELLMGHISPLKSKGLISTFSSYPISYNFLVSRVDKLFNVGFDLYDYGLSTTDYNDPFFGIIKVWTGQSICSTQSSGSQIGDYWNGNILGENINFIYLQNGMSGTVGVKVRLSDIREGYPLILSSGALSGCTSIYGVDSDFLYAFHIGQRPGDDEWKTAFDGVHTLLSTCNKLTMESSSILTKNRLSNSDILDILSFCNKATVTYLGKEGTTFFGNRKIDVFDYNKRITPKGVLRVGLSYCLIARSRNQLIVKTLSEDGSLIYDRQKEVHKYQKLANLKNRLI